MRFILYLMYFFIFQTWSQTKIYPLEEDFKHLHFKTFNSPDFLKLFNKDERKEKGHHFEVYQLRKSEPIFYYHMVVKDIGFLKLKNSNYSVDKLKIKVEPNDKNEDFLLRMFTLQFGDHDPMDSSSTTRKYRFKVKNGFIGFVRELYKGYEEIEIFFISKEF